MSGGEKMTSNSNLGSVPHVGELQPRHPNMTTESKILNLISSRQASGQTQPPELVNNTEVAQPSKPEGTMRQLSLPVAPSGLSATAVEFVPQALRVQSHTYTGYTNVSSANSDLSVNAPEFYTGEQEGDYGYNGYVDYYLGNNFGDLTLDDTYEGGDQPYYSSHYPQASSIEERFDLALKILTTNPSNVEEYLKPICRDIAATATYDSVAPIIVENLYQQCISEENFRYIGARICQYLNTSLNSTFIKLFVKKCQVDFNQRDQLLHGSPADKKKIQGLGMLLAEIFRNVETAGSDGAPERLSFLPTILIQLVKSLLSVPDDANIKYACQLLKLSGSLIEDVVKSSPDDCIHFEGLFDTLRKMLTSSQLSENAKFHVEKLVDLKDNSWDTALPSQGSSNIYNPYADYNQGGAMGGFPLVSDQEALFYDQLSRDSDDSVSHLLTEEEEADFIAWQNSQFGDSYKQDSGMGNEMEEAYEEFLNQQTPSYNYKPPAHSQPPPPPPSQPLPTHSQDHYRYSQMAQNQYPYNYYPPQENHFSQHQYNHHIQQPYRHHYNQNQHHQQQQHQQHHHHHHHHQQQQQQHQPQQPRYSNQNQPPNDPYHYVKRS